MNMRRIGFVFKRPSSLTSDLFIIKINDRFPIEMFTGYLLIVREGMHFGIQHRIFILHLRRARSESHNQHHGTNH